MPAPDAVLAEIEAAWPDAIVGRIVGVSAARPGESVYAVAFWGRYMDYEVFGEPPLAVNVEGHPSAAGVRWAPPNWADPGGGGGAGLAGLYGRLSAALPATEDADGSEDPVAEAEWDRVWAAHDAVLCRICRAVTAAARSGAAPWADLPLGDRFAAAVLDEQDDDDLERLSRESLGDEYRSLGLPWAV